VSKRYFLPDGRELHNVHDDSLCAGRVCIIHNPTEHHMVEWQLHWRDDRGIFERICEHGVGHPDFDQHEYWREANKLYEAIHGCDLQDGRPCCAPTEP
jgi:hypothetical protein